MSRASIVLVLVWWRLGGGGRSCARSGGLAASNS